MRSDDFPHATPSHGDPEPPSPLAGDTLDRLLTRSLDETRTEQVRQYFATSAARQRLLAQLQAWVRQDESGQAPFDQDVLWTKLSTAPIRKLPNVPTRGTHIVPRGALYAMLCLVIGALGLIVGWKGHAIRNWVARPRPTAVSTYVTANGERANITLPDGTSISLGVASRLDVPSDYAAGHHTVHLMGEALFTVTQHEGTPFIVQTGTTTARVLGTSFAVRHYRTDSTATVAVREGKVAVGNVVVTAAQLAEVTPSGATQLHPTDASAFNFAVGVLSFKNVPLSQAIPELDRWYAADIRLGDKSLAQIPIEGDLTAGSLSDLADVLGGILNVRPVREGRVITLYPKAR